jgi:hypothetical protein
MNVYEVRLMSGHTFEVSCRLEEIDLLLILIGEENIDYTEQL